jgi:hypothetical protein
MVSHFTGWKINIVVSGRDPKKKEFLHLRLKINKIGAGGKSKIHKSFWWTHCGVQWLMHHQISLLFIVVMVKCINKNEKGKRYTQLNKLETTKKRNNCYFYPDETILLKQQIHMIRYLPMRELSYLTREYNNIYG